MAISPPNYQKDAVPTMRGWTHPRTGELLKAQKLTQEQIDEYNGVSTAQTLTESPVNEEEFAAEHLDAIESEDVITSAYDDDEDEYWTEEDIDGMTKLELEELGREYGIELDRRHNKEVLVEQLKAVMFEEE